MIDGSTPQEQLQQCLKLKPSRAIDVLLTQNSLPSIQRLSTCLQDQIGRNTSNLKSALSNNYSRLLECSALLDRIHSFTKDIHQIEVSIKQVLDIEDPNAAPQIHYSPLTHAEMLLNNKLYSQAMRTAVQPMKDVEAYYQPYFQLQILEKLQRDVAGSKLTPHLIQEAVSCLQLQHSNHLQQPCRSTFIQVIFKWKLQYLSQINNIQLLVSFFKDIADLIKENKELSAVFVKNISTIETNLADIFITKHDFDLHFQDNIYNQAIHSQILLQILSELQSRTDYSIYTFLTTLQDNYAHMLIQMMLDECSIPKHIPKVQPQPPLPDEFAYYVVDKDTSNEVIKKYQDTVGVNLQRIANIVGKKTQNAQLCVRKLQQMQNEVQQHIISAEELRSVVLAVLLQCELEYHVQSIINIDVQWRIELESFKRFAFDNISALKHMDRFFLSYHVKEYYKGKMRKIVLYILEGMMYRANQDKAKQFFREKESVEKEESEVRGNPFLKKKAM